MRTIQLPSYPVHLYHQDESPDWQHLFGQKTYSKIFVLVDEHTEIACLPLLGLLKDQATILRIHSGEQHKNIESCTALWAQMLSENADRNTLFLNLGGGVIGDMGGFVASTYKRGIDFIQIPTTLLSMVDASVGGKLGIDHQGLKNVIGLFQDPVSIIVAPAFLSTLPDVQLRSGFAEVLKHGLIADAEYWQHVSKIDPMKSDDFTQIIARSIEIKRRVVEEDPTEKGRRKILNYGHTIGHALETYALQNNAPILHGEAIALGMIAEAWLSHRLTGLPKPDVMEITTRIRKVFPDITFDATAIPDYLSLMKHDKKNEHGHILFSLLEGIGQCTFNVQVSEQDILQSFKYLSEV